MQQIGPFNGGVVRSTHQDLTHRNQTDPLDPLGSGSNSLADPNANPNANPGCVDCAASDLDPVGEWERTRSLHLTSPFSARLTRGPHGRRTACDAKEPPSFDGRLTVWWSGAVGA